MDKTKRGRGGYRSLFWPFMLIAVGVFWLLGNAGLISGANIAVLFRLWPVILIAIGLDLLVGRGSPAVGAVIGLGTAALLIMLMLAGPGLGLAPDQDVTQSTFSEPLGDARSAAVTLDFSVGTSAVHMQDGADLFSADLNHVGNIRFDVTGSTEKTVYLGQDGETSVTAWPFGNIFPGNDDLELRWDVRLSPEVPLALTVNGGVGETTLNLDGLTLSALDVDSGVGNMDITLPESAEPYPATINSGVGEIRIAVPEGAVNLTINGGVGSVTLDLPDRAAVRLEAESGLGAVNVPGWLERVSGDDGDGVWQSEGFASARETITISYNGGVGSLNIR